MSEKPEHPYVVAALVRRRSELSGEIERSQQQLRQMIMALEHLDKTLLMFAPEYKIEGIKPKQFRAPSEWSKRGEMKRRVLEILREATLPMTSRDIAMVMISERGLEQDEATIRTMSRRCAETLRLQRLRGVAHCYEGPGFCLLWQLDPA